MTNILSSISGYFSRSLILGTFLPVVVFVLLGWLFVTPIFPAEWPFLKPLEALDTQWKVLVISFMTIVMTGLLYNLNIPIIRAYEGYQWKDWWIGELRKNRYKRIFRSIDAQWRGLPVLQFELNKISPHDPRIEQIDARIAIVGRRLNTEFPKGEEFVLPTRLGNVIRSFEDYAERQYGLEAVTFWPRLAANVDKDYSAVVDNAKTSFDFMLNSSVLSTILAFAILLAGLIYRTPLVSLRLTLFWLAELIIFWAMAYFLYVASIGRASAWGNLVKGAFDLYRWALLKQLGFTQVPRTVKEERVFWKNISQQMIYGDFYLIPPIEYTSKSTFAQGVPDVVEMETGRAISLLETAAARFPLSTLMEEVLGTQLSSDTTGEIKVTLRVKNTGRVNAKSVTVTDTLPDGFEYKWNSATVTNPNAPDHTAVVTGANPYCFTAGALNSKSELTLTYHALPVRQKELKYPV